jgi:hypothetical protein
LGQLSNISNFIHLISSNQFTVVPQLPFAPESAPLNDATNPADFPKESISEIVYQNSSNFFPQ